MDEGFCVIEVIFDENEKAIDYLFLEVNEALRSKQGSKRLREKRCGKSFLI